MYNHTVVIVTRGSVPQGTSNGIFSRTFTVFASSYTKLQQHCAIQIVYPKKVRSGAMNCSNTLYETFLRECAGEINIEVLEHVGDLNEGQTLVKQLLINEVTYA